MITNFEHITFELTDYEIEYILPFVVSELENRFGKLAAISNKSLVARCPMKTSGPRIRKVIHELRAKGILPNILANSYGYYRSTDVEEIDIYIKSCQERVNSIREIIYSLERQKYGQRNLNEVPKQLSLSDAFFTI